MKIEATGLSFLGISAASLCVTSHVTFSKCFPNSQSAGSQLLNSWVWSLFLLKWKQAFQGARVLESNSGQLLIIMIAVFC